MGAKFYTYWPFGLALLGGLFLPFLNQRTTPVITSVTSPGYSHAAVTRIPFELNGSNIFFQARVNNSSPQITKSLPPTLPTVGRGVGGEIPLPVGRVPQLQLGLKPDDSLIAIDGRPAQEIGLRDIREMFKHPGRTYALEIQRGGESLHLKLTTRRLI